VFSIRFLLAILAFIAYATQYSQSINMSVAILCMSKQDDYYNFNETTFPFLSIDQCKTEKIDYKRNKSNNLELDLDKKLQGKVIINNFNLIFNKVIYKGIILASYFVGYLPSGIPGGFLSLKFGPKIIIALAILISSVLTILTPFVAQIHVALLILCRFLIGLVHVYIL
jgi:MFS transporter, ACS family, solute carrier family 17 (sodium-dependent inorganic phosphate cotransporter), member 5